MNIKIHNLPRAPKRKNLDQPQEEFTADTAGPKRDISDIADDPDAEESPNVQHREAHEDPE